MPQMYETEKTLYEIIIIYFLPDLGTIAIIMAGLLDTGI